MKGSLREIAASLNVDNAGPKHSYKTPSDCRSVVASAIMKGQDSGCMKMLQESLQHPFEFLIDNHIFDETKLWYIVPGKGGYRHWSTLNHHAQVTWKDGVSPGIRDEDLIMLPKSMRRYTASCQWNILVNCNMQFGLLPAKGLRPRARYQGTLTASDYHGVNVLTLKYLRRVLPEDHLLLPSHCLQHAAGNTAAGLAQYLNIFTRVWTLSKTFAEGDFHQDLVNKFHSALEDEEHGLEIVDPDVFELGANDLGQAFTNTLLDTCYLQGLAPGEVGSEPGKDVQQVRDEFGKFFPCGWNRKRVLHPCPAGCCGPTPCHCRKTSLEKAKRLTARVILKRIKNPAKNKWTKMHPAMAQATLIVCFFSIVQQALEAKTRVTYEELMAEGGPEEREEPQEGDGQAQDDQPSFKGLMKRFGKRCLAFVGDPTTKTFLLVWAVVGHVLMVMHFRFFKHCTFFSHFDPRSGERRISITDFCPGPGGEIKTNPASQALTDLAKLLFDPHGEGYVLAQPLMTMFGRTLDWTSQLVLVSKVGAPCVLQSLAANGSQVSMLSLAGGLRF